MRIPTLPPNIGWPLLVVCLLSISISASVYTLLAAQSDGGPAIVDNYYAKGSNFDATAAARDAARDLRVDVAVHAEGDTPGLRPVVVTIRTADAPLTGLNGTVLLSRPHVAGALSTVPLHPTDTPGVYRQLLPIQSTGLWDVTVEARSAERVSFEKTVRIDLPTLP